MGLKMIKYKNTQDSKNYFGLQITGMTFIMINVEIVIFLIKILRNPIDYKRFLWIKPLSILFFFLVIYLLLSLIHMEWSLSKGQFTIALMCTTILTAFGYQWFPYWEEESNPDR